jgi:CRISPR-associated protein Csx10
MTGRDVLRVTVTARQRLALGVGSEVSFFTDSHRYAPGSVLRGALAAAWIADHGVPAGGRDAEDFRALFDGPVRYGPLFVPGTVVVPVSAWLCKYPDDGKACREQAVDAAFEKGDECPACGGPLERGKGQVNLPGGVGLERITRTSIDKETGKAADGELYANAALPAGTVLTGYIHGRRGWLETPRRLRLGGRRTVSGAADYQAVPLSPGEEDPLPYEWPGLPAEPVAVSEPLPPDRLVIRLASPAVFTDPCGQPLLEPHPDLDLTIPGLGQATVDRRWVRAVIWSGWHAASRLPKPDETCAAAGSAYRLAGPPEVLHALAEKLAWEGAGLRRGEGFGVIRIARRPWRPPVPLSDRTPGPEAAGTAVTARLDELRGFRLTAQQWRWTAAALRELQLIREHTAPGADDDPVTELLRRPAAGDLSGLQRDQLRGLFGRLDKRQLRDLTTLLLAEEGDQ